MKYCECVQFFAYLDGMAHSRGLKETRRGRTSGSAETRSAPTPLVPHLFFINYNRIFFIFLYDDL